MDSKGLSSDSFHETVDMTSYQLVGKSLFKPTPEIREHILNLTLKNNPSVQEDADPSSTPSLTSQYNGYLKY